MIHDGGGGALPVTGLYCIARPVLHSTSTALPMPAKTGISHGLWADFEGCFRLFQLFAIFSRIQYSILWEASPLRLATHTLCRSAMTPSEPNGWLRDITHSPFSQHTLTHTGYSKRPQFRSISSNDSVCTPISWSNDRLIVLPSMWGTGCFR